jgi:hypothetical protein
MPATDHLGGPKALRAIAAGYDERLYFLHLGSSCPLEPSRSGEPEPGIPWRFMPRSADSRDWPQCKAWIFPVHRF